MARIPPGQNTALTLIAKFVAESGTDLNRDGGIGTFTSYLTGGQQHLRDGSGGEYAVGMNLGTFFTIPFRGLAVREPVVALALWGNPPISFAFQRAGTDFQSGFELTSGNAVRFFSGQNGYTSFGTVLTAGTTGYVPADVYSWAHLWAFIDDSTGFLRLRMFSWANQVLTYSGDTEASLTYNNTDALYVQVIGLLPTNLVRVDDVYVYARTMYYSGGSGTLPVSGATVTGPDGSFNVDFVEGDNVSGVMVVYTVNGFITATDALTSGGWSAVAENDLANDKASLWVQETFGQATDLDSDVAAAWTGSTGAAHYTQLNDWVTTSSFVFTETPGQTDQYGTVSVGVPGASTVLALTVSAWAQSAGSTTVEQIQLGLVAGGTSNGPAQTLPSDWGLVDMYFTNNPATGAAFTPTQANAVEGTLISVA